MVEHIELQTPYTNERLQAAIAILVIFKAYVLLRQATGSNDTPSQLSGFLVGCDNGGAILTVACPERTTGCGVSQNGTACVFPLNTPGTEIIADPVYNPGNNNSFNNTFADIQRRVNCMSTILNNSGSVCCDGAGNLGTHCN